MKRVREKAGVRVVGVTGASGGVGTSCLAAALATRAALQGARAACADAHPLGGGIDALFDLESRPGARWPDLARVDGRVAGEALLRHLPVSADGVWVLSAGVAALDPADPAGPLAAEDPADRAPHGSPQPVLAGLASGLDRLVLDLGTASEVVPPDPGVAALCSDVVLVVGAGVPALARALRAAAVVSGWCSDRVWLAQRCPRGQGDLADLVAGRLGLPLLGAVPDDPRLDQALARGSAPGAGRSRIGALADDFWAVLARQERVA